MGRPKGPDGRCCGVWLRTQLTQRVGLKGDASRSRDQPGLGTRGTLSELDPHVRAWRDQGVLTRQLASVGTESVWTAETPARSRLPPLEVPSAAAHGDVRSLFRTLSWPLLRRNAKCVCRRLSSVLGRAPVCLETNTT